MKYIYLSLVFCLASNIGFSQGCVVEAFSTKDTIVCGQNATLSAYGRGQGIAVLSENFNNGAFGTGWNASPQATWTNPCSPSGVDGTTHIWLGNQSPVPRVLTTAPFNLSSCATAGVTICFDLLFAEQGGASPCEGPDEPDEGVYLQYSTNNGSTWTDIHYFDPNGGSDPDLINWKNWCFQVPAVALTSSTLFRWFQDNDSGADYDHWGIDNVVIYCNDPTFNIVWTHDGYNQGPAGGINPTPVAPRTTTSYVVVMSNGTVTCRDTVKITVKNPTVLVDAGRDTSICPGQCAKLNGSTKVIINPAKVVTYANNEITSITTGFGAVTNIGINVTGLNMPTVLPNSITQICIKNIFFFGQNFFPPGQVTIRDLILSVKCPSGQVITLVPANVTTGGSSPLSGGYTNTCFVPVGGTNIASASAPYSGSYSPNQPFNNLAGCTSNGVWEFNVSMNSSLGFGTGTFSGWSITFDDPEISYTSLYNWSPTSNMTGGNTLTPTVCPPSNTTYTLTARDSANCITNADVVNVSILPSCCNLTLPSTKSLTQCQATTGTITVTPNGGTPPYTYTWADNASINSGSRTGLGPGTYYVTVTAGAGCVKDTMIELTAPNSPQIQNDSVWKETCIGLNNGGVRVSAVASAFYSLNIAPLSNPSNVTNNGTNNFFLNLAPGTYIIGILDNNGCVDTIIRTVAPGVSCCNLAIQSKTVTQPTCGLNNGAISVTMSGGTLPYTYTWTPNVSSTNTASNLAGGSYRVVISAGAGCTKDTTFTLAGTTAPNINSVTATNEICQGQNNGSVTAVNTTGGSPTYAYGYSPSSNPLSVTPIASFPLSNLAPGTYIMGVQDLNSCRDTVWFTISAGPNCCNVALQSATLTQPTCGQSNGAISLNVTGGTLPYTYTWTPNVSTSNAATNLAAGPYRVVIGAGTNCAIDTTFNLNSNSTLALALTNPVNPSCTASNGQITAALSGGTAPYSVTIDTGGTPQTFSVPLAITQTISNLPEGTINISVTDAQSCTVTRSVTLTRPTAPTINSLSKTDEQCAGANDGALISVNTTGGSGGYTYTYAPQSNPSSTLAIANFPVNNLADGTYILSVQDGNGCNDTAWFTIVAGPICCNLNLSAVLTNPACGQLNGAIDVTTLLGSGNYTYAWSPGSQVTEDISGVGVGNFTITITDVTQGCSKDSTFNLSNINGPVIDSVQKRDETCNGKNDGSVRLFARGGAGTLTYIWSPALTNSNNQIGLAPNTYSYTVSDANNCEVTGVQTVRAGITVVATNVATDPNCSGNNGQIQASATPIGSYQFSISGSTSNATGLFQNLGAGSYTVTVTSANGCTATTSATLTSPTSFAATISSQNISCYGVGDGSATVNVVGGAAPVTITWSNAEQTTTITSLAAGTYTVTISDAANCSTVLSTTIIEPAKLSVSLGNDTAFCGTSLVLNAQNPGLNYTWSTTESSQSITVLGTNNYAVTVSDASGCSASANINVSIYPQVAIELRKDTTIFDGGEVILTSTITGGSGSGSYSWTPTTDLSCADCALPTSTTRDTIGYLVTYTDDAGCIATDLINIYFDNDFSLYAPNAFTPNGDNKNNVYQVFGRGIESLVLKIYNRWGEKVFESTDQKIGWDGTFKGSSQPVGVYIFEVQATYFNGKTKREKGSLTLIR